MVSPFACGAYGLRMSDLISPQDAHWPKAAIFTVGHSTLPIERFVELLKIYGIEQLVDIRTMPGSRHNPQFGREALAGSLKAGIGWAAEGPRAGFFPFYVCLIVLISCGVNLVNAVRDFSGRELFAEWSQLRRPTASRRAKSGCKPTPWMDRKRMIPSCESASPPTSRNLDLRVITSPSALRIRKSSTHG